MLSICLILIFFVLPAAIGVFIWQTSRERDLLFRTLVSLLPLAFSAALFDIVCNFCAAGQFDWNGAKLAPILAMTHGFPLYGDPDSGVMSAWIYGPVPAFFFLPTAIFTRPTSVILAGVIINTLITFAPVAWALLRGRRPGEWLAFAAAAILFIWVVQAHESLRRVIYMTGPDGPTVALMAVSCLALAGGRRTLWRIILSSLCAVLACWCKQSVIPFLLVGPLFVLLADGFREFVRHAGVLAVTALIVSSILVISFGPSNMWFQMVEVSSHHGFTDMEHGKIVALLYGLGDLIVDLAPTLTIFAIMMLVHAQVEKRAEPAAPPAVPSQALSGWQTWIIANNDLALFLATSVVMIPSAILGYMKVGGYLNNFALTHYFLLLAVCLFFERSWLIWRERSQPIARWTMAAVCLFAISNAAAMISPPGTLEAARLRISHPFDNTQEAVYDFEKAHPHTIYFPWNTLATLQADGELFHFEWGLVDRFEANLKPSADQLLAHIPKGARFIGYGPRHQSEATNHYLLEQLGIGTLSRVAVTALPKFEVYAFGNGALPGQPEETSSPNSAATQQPPPRSRREDPFHL